MNNFLQLLINELIKVYIRKSIWIMYGILGVLIIGFGILDMNLDDYDETKYSNDNWREIMLEENEKIHAEYESIHQKVAEGEEDVFYLGDSIDTVYRNEAYLAYDIQPTKYGAWQFTAESAALLSLVTFITIIIASGIVANEFRWGTIKQLLIRPIRRTTILASKYVAVLLFALFTLLFVMIVAWLTGAILYGFDYPSDYMLVYNYQDDSDSLYYMLVPIGKELLSSYGYKLVNLVMMATFAFMISSIFRTSSLATGLAVFFLMGGNIIVGIFQNRPFAKYILFANTDLKQYETGNVWIEGMSLSFSIKVLIVYYLLFILLAWVFFVKRDISTTE